MILIKDKAKPAVEKPSVAEISGNRLFKVSIISVPPRSITSASTENTIFKIKIIVAVMNLDQ